MGTIAQFAQRMPSHTLRLETRETRRTRVRATAPELPKKCHTLLSTEFSAVDAYRVAQVPPDHPRVPPEWTCFNAEPANVHLTSGAMGKGDCRYRPSRALAAFHLGGPLPGRVKFQRSARMP